MAKWKPFQFIDEVKRETKRISWPTMSETRMSTIMVFIMVAVTLVTGLAGRFVGTRLGDAALDQLSGAVLGYAIAPYLYAFCRAIAHGDVTTNPETLRPVPAVQQFAAWLVVLCLVAGLYDVPVVFAAGDKAFVDQVRGLLGSIETVATKAEIGGGAITSLSPAEAQRQIKAGVERGIRARDRFKPYKMTPPYSMVLKVRADKPLYKGAERPRPGESVFHHADLLEVLNAFNAMK